MSLPAPLIADTNGVTDLGVSSPGVTAPARADSAYSSDEEKGKDSSATSATSSSEQLQKYDHCFFLLTGRFYEPPDSWESKHRWDPAATWTPEEEKKLLRKIDLRVAFAACIFFGCLCLDRSNISNALSDNMLNDLNLTTYHYNIGQTIFYCSFLFAELPSQMSTSPPPGRADWSL